MDIINRVRGALRRVGEVSEAAISRQPSAFRNAVAMLTGGLLAGGREGRRTAGAGSNLAPFASPSFARGGVPGSGSRTSASHNLVPKPSPANLRRFAETPVARRAINVIKDRIVGMRWRIQPRSGRVLAQLPDGAQRIAVLTRNFEAPNPDDSFRSLLEQVLEDVIVGGFGAIELQTSGQWSVGGGQENLKPSAVSHQESTQYLVPSTQNKPLLMWPVDGATIRIMTDWDGRPDSPRYAQVTGLSGAAGQIVLNDDELSYIRLNPRTHTPFGLGRLEVAFETINAFMSANRYAGRLASNSVVQYALWVDGLTPAHHERLIRWWQDEIEGTGRVPIISAETKPEILRFAAGNDADLRLAWQEFLMRIIADAFDIPAQFLGLEQDVNRSTAAEMSEMAFRSAIVPTARLVAEYLTRDVIAKKLGWDDLEFVFTDVDAQNEMEQAQIDEILLRNGIVSVAEVRRARGLAEIL
jgi:hypothetical protein